MQDIQHFQGLSGPDLAEQISDYAKDNDCHVDNISYSVSRYGTHNAIVVMTKNTYI